MIENKISVSICIPVYNGGEYLDECIQSAVRQVYSAFEIVIVDDQSKDNSVEIINKWIAKDQRIRLFVNEKNLGLTGNWNACLQHAKGEWIKFLFQDDILAPDCLQKMLMYADKAKFISAERNFIFEEGVDEITRHQYSTQLTSPADEFSLKQPSLISAEALCRKVIQRNSSNFIGEPTAVMFRRDLIEECGMFSVDYDQICDLEYWIRIGSIHGLFHIPEGLAFFRVHPQSTSSENKKVRMELADGAVFIYDLLYHEYYSSFRKYLNSFNHWKLKVIMSVRVFEMKDLAKKQMNEKMKRRAEKIFQLRPLITTHLLPSAVTAIIYFFIRIKRNLRNR
ncbi:MAG: glycosyltransferase family 2 protein [Bacteroidota bacterium]